MNFATHAKDNAAAFLKPYVCKNVRTYRFFFIKDSLVVAHTYAKIPSSFKRVAFK